jgi:hypothetical protein
MKWTQPPTPELGEWRTRRGFLLFPVTLFAGDGDLTKVTRWLEFAVWSEHYCPGEWKPVFWGEING